MDYYIYKNDQNVGPLPESEVVGGLRNGRFASNDLSCRVGESQWKDLSFFFPAETSPPLNPAGQTAQPPPVYQQPQRVVQQSPAPYQSAPIAASSSSDVNRLMFFEANKKSTGVAYLLWFFLGMLGAHRFYLGQTGTAVAQLVITLVSFVLFVVLIGFFTIWISAIWVLIDIFLIPQMARQYNNKLLAQTNAFR